MFVSFSGIPRGSLFHTPRNRHFAGLSLGSQLQSRFFLLFHSTPLLLQVYLKVQ